MNFSKINLAPSHCKKCTISRQINLSDFEITYTRPNNYNQHYTRLPFSRTSNSTPVNCVIIIIGIVSLHPKNTLCTCTYNNDIDKEHEASATATPTKCVAIYTISWKQVRFRRGSPVAFWDIRTLTARRTKRPRGCGETLMVEYGPWLLYISAYKIFPEQLKWYVLYYSLRRVT